LANFLFNTHGNWPDGNGLDNGFTLNN